MSIQFTLEPEDNKAKINFLDIDIFRLNNSIPKINWYRKPTYSGRYLNFLSHHPFAQKIAIIYNLVDKCINLADPDFQIKNLNFAKKILYANNYPKDIVQKYIKKRMLYHNNKINTENFDHLTKRINRRLLLNKKRIVLPYISGFSDNLKKALKHENINFIFKNVNKFSTFITLGKDKLKTEEKSNIVYKINCNDCEAVYISQSGRKLQCRKNEHIKDVEKLNEKSALANHVRYTGHKINFEKVKILDTEVSKRKRLFSEMINIYYHNNTLNRINDK